MKLSVYLILASALILSCTPQAQLFTLQSSDPDLNKNNFLYKDSLITITYNFYSLNGTMRFTIHNNHDKPVFINWKNSMLITPQNKTLAYWIDKAQIEGQAGDNLSGSINKSSSIGFMPPGTDLEMSEFTIGNGIIYSKTGTTVETEPINWKKTPKAAEIIHAEYDYVNTPLKFRNYLVIDTSEEFKNPIYYDFEFWLSDIHEMDLRQLVGSFFFSDSFSQTQMDSPYHPYKSPNRFFGLLK
jgi:hypothetical protein